MIAYRLFSNCRLGSLRKWITPAHAAFAFAGLILLLTAFGPSIRSTLGRNGARNDFVSFYAGAKLVSGCTLYRYDRILEAETRLGMRARPHLMCISACRSTPGCSVPWQV
jgi:hypothetical protein